MKLLVRGAIVCLLAFYLYLAYLMTHPNVSQAYREYYILRSSGLSIAERRNLAPLRPGQDYSHQTTAIGFDGWSGAEPTHRWNDGKSARIIFKLDAAALAQAPRRLVLTLMPHGPQRTHWRLNGTGLGERQVAREMQLAFALSPGLLREGDNVLEVDMPDAHRPDNGDGRVLGLAIKSFRLD